MTAVPRESQRGPSEGHSEGPLPAKSTKSLQFTISAADSKIVMWCATCGQDVPGVALTESDGLGCARCGRRIGQPSSVPDETAGDTGATGADATEGSAADSTGLEPPPRWRYDSWEMDEQLRHVARRLGRGERAADELPTSVGSSESDHRSPLAWHLGDATRRADDRWAPRSGRRSLLGQVFLGLGVMGSVCGGVLLAWSVIAERNELWDAGMPIALVGQAALLLALILHLERFWRDGRHAAEKLDRFEGQLRDLQTSALPDMGHGFPRNTLHRQTDSGDDPQMLLADLKGQLEQLAVQLQQRV